MRNSTRLLFSTFLSTVAALNGVADATLSFAVEPSVSQKLEKRIQESADFLTLINVEEVDEIKGDKVGISVIGTVAGRTNTDAADRTPRQMSALSSDGYECQKTDYDTAIKYATLDKWRHRPEFQILLRDAIIRQQGLDRLKIGFNGISIAADTDRVANPMLEDVNEGWLQKIRARAAGQHLDGINIGVGLAGATYKNLDQAAMDAKSILHATLRNDPDLVVICASDLLSDKYVSLAGDHGEPTEREALARIMQNKKVGGLPAIEAPYFPSGAFLITKLSNLSIYVQTGSRRRNIVDNSKRDRIENYESVNEDYVIEEYEAAVFVENINVPNAGATAWVPFA